MSGESRLTIRTKFGFCFLIVTPAWLTIAGSDEAACDDAVLHVDGGDAQRIADIEGDGDGRRAVVGARRGHVGHAGDAVDLLLERRRDRVGDDLRAGARIDAR